MTLDEAKTVKEQNIHLIGTVYKKLIVLELVIAPGNTEPNLFDSVSRQIQDYGNYRPFLNGTDYEVFVLFCRPGLQSHRHVPYSLLQAHLQRVIGQK